MKQAANNPNTRTRRQSRTGSGRDHLLDVRVRRSTAKRRRNHRTLSVLFGVVFWIGLAIGVCFGFREVVNRFFLENPEYNLRVVDTELDDLMTPEEAMQISGITKGKNIFRIDLAAAEKSLQEIDQIDRVTIQRDWPDKITIKITKRIPVAWLARAGSSDTSPEHTLLIDADGRTMKPYRIEPEYWHLPVIYVTDPALIQQGEILAVDDLRKALNLLAERAKRPGSLLDIISLDITSGYAIEVIDADKAHYTFGPDDLASQLDRLQKLLVNSRDTGRQIESVNLIPKKYTPVRFQLVAATVPKPDDRKMEDSH